MRVPPVSLHTTGVRPTNALPYNLQMKARLNIAYLQSTHTHTILQRGRSSILVRLDCKNQTPSKLATLHCVTSSDKEKVRHRPAERNQYPGTPWSIQPLVRGTRSKAEGRCSSPTRPKTAPLQGDSGGRQAVVAAMSKRKEASPATASYRLAESGPALLANAFARKTPTRISSVLCHTRQLTGRKGWQQTPPGRVPP